MSFQITHRFIKITQGDTFYMPLKFPFDITGACLVMQIRDQDTGALIVNKIISEHTNALNGETLLHLEAQETNLPLGCYETDIKIVFSNKDEITFFPATVGKIAQFIVCEKISKEA